MEELLCLSCHDPIEPIVGERLYRIHLGEVFINSDEVQFEEWDDAKYLCYDCADQHYVPIVETDPLCCSLCGEPYQMEFPDEYPADDEWKARMELVHIVESSKGPFPRMEVYKWGIVHRDCANTDWSLPL